jgi:hypothetical protein
VSHRCKDSAFEVCMQSMRMSLEEVDVWLGKADDKVIDVCSCPRVCFSTSC